MHDLEETNNSKGISLDRNLEVHPTGISLLSY